MKTRRIFVLWLVLVLAFPLFLSRIVRAENGDHVNVDRSFSSNLLIIGDSMVVVLSEDVPKASYNATSGGHFVYDRELVTGEWQVLNRVISSRKYLAQQKALIRRILRRQGSCVVVLVGSYNDVDYDGGWENATLSSLLDLKETLESVSVGKKHPEVYVTSIIPDKGEDEYVEEFNHVLKERLGGAYIELGLTSVWEDYYWTDDSHLIPEGSELMYQKIMDAVTLRSGNIRAFALSRSFRLLSDFRRIR